MAVILRPYHTLQIDAGKKQKIRPGDILGDLIGDNGIAGDQVSKIKLAPPWAYITVSREALKPALRKLEQDKIKGKTVRVRVLRG